MPDLSSSAAEDPPAAAVVPAEMDSTQPSEDAMGPSPPALAPASPLMASDGEYMTYGKCSHGSVFHNMIGCICKIVEHYRIFCC